MRRILPIAALILAPWPLLAQTPGAHFEIRTANGQTTFHIGERIPLILSFTAPENTYDIALYNFGRMDPLRLDSFAITPSDGWSDSLAAYAALASGLCCGARQEGKLSPKPTTLPVDLNEWARFDEPRTYTLTITSYRIEIPHVTTLDHRTDLPSNPLQIHIIAATPAWQNATLIHALKTLAVPDADETDNGYAPHHLAAMADLRYLDSPPAIAALAASLRGEDYNVIRNAMCGIIGLPRKLRDVGLAAMNKLIDDPDFPVLPEFLETIAWLQLDDASVPRLDTQADYEREYERFSAAHRAAMQPPLDAAWQTIATQLPRKTGLARSTTAQTLVAMPPAHPSPNDLKLIGAVLRESFPTLSASDKRDLLTDHWDTISSRSLLPQLRALATAAPRNNENEEVGYGKTLRVAALARWYEFEPEAATAEILRLIGTRTPTLSAKDLDFLPPQTFPQFEDLWAQTYAQDDDPINYGYTESLLLRFGTGAAAPRLISLIQHLHTDCYRGDAIIAYLIKFDPESAKRFLNTPPPPNPTDALDCSIRRLDLIGKFVQDPILTDAALTAIKSTSNDVVTDALSYLIKFDDDASRAPILARYLQWSARQEFKPAPPPDEADILRESANPVYAQTLQASVDRQLGNDLARALLSNQAWIPDADLISTLTDHCISKDVCDTVKLLSEPDRTVSGTPHSDYSSFHIGPFQPATLDLLEAKLDQFPKGTAFTLNHSNTGNDAAQNKFEATLPALFAKHGMTLAPPAP
jgi:hypothetical protein